MTHDEEAIIILSVVITPDVAEHIDYLVCLDGPTREEVASFYLCKAFGKKPPHPQFVTMPPGSIPPGGPNPNPKDPE